MVTVQGGEGGGGTYLGAGGEGEGQEGESGRTVSKQNAQDTTCTTLLLLPVTIINKAPISLFGFSFFFFVFPSAFSFKKKTIPESLYPWANAGLANE